MSFPTCQKLKVFEESNATNFIAKECYPLLKFTSDDKLMFRYNKKSIELYDRELNPAGLIDTGVLNLFSLSKVSKDQDYLLVSFSLDAKSRQGTMLVYNQSSLEKPTYSKHIEKAQEVKVKWNPVCHDFLIELQTYFDHSGKSYYGEYGLYFFNSALEKLHRVRTYEGPIHDFSWDPTGDKFVVISGFMPAGCVLFNNKN